MKYIEMHYFIYIKVQLDLLLLDSVVHVKKLSNHFNK